MSFSKDIEQAQSALLANDYTLGQGFTRAAKFGNRTELFAAIRAGDQCEAGRIFMDLLDNELRAEAVRLVSERLDEEVAAVRQDFDSNYSAQVKRLMPNTPRAMTGD